MTDSDERPETWKPIPRIAGCTYSGYEVSDKGRARSIDRKQGNRQLRGKVLASRLDGGYVLINIRCDSTDPDHDRVHTFQMHRLVLITFDRECPRGMEACHSERGPAFNWWPEGVRWDTKAANHADMVAAGTAVTPMAFECINHARCGGMTRTPGKRCTPCVYEVGELGLLMVNTGLPALEAAQRFGYTDDRFFLGLIEEHGYKGTRAQARTQRPTMAQRMALLGVMRLARRSGQLR